MQLVSIPENPAPEDVVTGMLKTPDGFDLRFARFAPPAGRKGTVCLLQGRADFIEKYFETINDLRSRGFAVATFDWRGQGLSRRSVRDSSKGHVRRFAEYDTDLEAFMREIVLPDCPPPFFALGHAMGATVLIRAASQGRRWFDRTVLAAPMVGLERRRLMRLRNPLVQLMGYAGMRTAAIPNVESRPVALQPFDGNPLTSDPDRHARTAAVVRAEPRLGVGAPTVGWARAALRAIGEFSEPGYGARIRHPMMLVAAGHDQIVSTAAIEAFASNLRTGSHLMVPGARHELLMERNRFRAQFWAAFDAFVPGTAAS
ncbi:MAG TPA: alpha/beta hydrolase [Xanthobacteraceae bacterium]|jgi:lysophospholipase